MGVVSNRSTDTRRLAVVACFIALALAGMIAAVPTWAAPAADGEPLEILSIDLREGAPGVFVDVTASGPMFWTTFRDADDNVVVELPDSILAAGVAERIAGEGPVASVALVGEQRGSRPVTLVKIATHQRVEHTLSADGDRLEVHLTPVVGAPTRASFPQEPLPEEEEAEPAAVPLPEPAAAPDQAEPILPRAEAHVAALQPPSGSMGTPATGTADDPVIAPPPTGVPATRLEAVRVSSTAPVVVEVVGDGEFRYSYFSLDNPARFVLDLSGVVNESHSTAVAVGSDVVERVRVAQFKPFPDPVSRVVFDLTRDTVPEIASTPAGLSVQFAGAMASQGAQQVRPSQPVVEPDEPAEEELTVDMEPERVEIENEAAMDLEGEPTVEDTGLDEQLDVEVAQGQAQVQVEPAQPRAPRIAPPPAASDVEVFGRRPQIQREMPTPVEPEPEDGFTVREVAASETRFVGEPIDMSVRDADVVEVLRMFAEISDLNVVIQPGVSGNVTVELEGVPWDQALDQILKINGLGYELEGNIMRIAPTDVLAAEADQRQRLERAKALAVPLRTIMRRLSYAEAGAMASLLRSQGGLLSQRGTVIVDARTNSLIIKDLPEFMDTVVSVIELLDTPEPQVMIEARIVETTKRFSRTLGVEWSFLGESSAELGNTTGLEFPNNGSVEGGVNLLTGGDNGFINLALGNVLNSFTLNAALQAAESEGLINILSAPKVATLNNQTASIQSGLQIPVQTVANNTVTVQFINATLELRVTPQVTAEGTILMDIDIAKREPQLAFAIQGASNAPISTKQAQTRVIVRDGGTTVIGGIYEVSTDQGEDRVPGLANVPIIGRLFRNKRRTDENEELLIFITPRVINL